MTKKFFGLNLLGLAAFITLSFLPINDTNATIKIGASMPLTGNFAVPGSKHLEGYQMCVDIINRHGGWLDQEVELVVSDNRSDTETAIAQYERFINVEQYSVLMSEELKLSKSKKCSRLRKQGSLPRKNLRSRRSSKN